MDFLLLYGSIFLFTLLLTFIVRKWAIYKSVLDLPNERSSHTIPTPRGGGIAIVLTWFGGLIYLFINNKIERELFYALISGGLLALVSFMDDIMDLSPLVRLLAQSISAIAALFFLGGLNLFPELENKTIYWGINLIFLIGMVWFINLYNFLDGIDAYASLEAVLVTIGLYALTKHNIFLLLIAAVIGFLIWNWPKAKIFMGDVGSTQLGFILIVLAIFFHNNNGPSVFIWAALTSVFWLDATLTLFRRWRNKEKLSQAHKKHAYQRLNQYGFSHLKINLIVVIINSVIILLVILNKHYLKQDIWVLLLVVIIVYGFIKFVDKRFPFAKN